MRTAVRGAVVVGSDSSGGGERDGMCFVVDDFVVDEAAVLNARGSVASLDLRGFGSCGCGLGSDSCLGNQSDSAFNKIGGCACNCAIFSRLKFPAVLGVSLIWWESRNARASGCRLYSVSACLPCRFLFFLQHSSNTARWPPLQTSASSRTGTRPYSSDKHGPRRARSRRGNVCLVYAAAAELFGSRSIRRRGLFPRHCPGGSASFRSSAAGHGSELENTNRASCSRLRKHNRRGNPPLTAASLIQICADPQLGFVISSQHLGFDAFTPSKSSGQHG